MNILNVISQFEESYPYLEKDGYCGVFSASSLVMEYYIQKRHLEITSQDDVIDALYAIYAYELIHDASVVQRFCNYETLCEYNSILYKYLGSRNYEEIIMAINHFDLTLQPIKKLPY